MREEAGKGDIERALYADKYTTVDLSAIWVVNDNWEAQVSIKNAFDESAIVSHRPYGARPNRPRSVIGRIKYTF